MFNQYFLALNVDYGKKMAEIVIVCMRLKSRKQGSYCYTIVRLGMNLNNDTVCQNHCIELGKCKYLIQLESTESGFSVKTFNLTIPNQFSSTI